ncbi:hypothetical protein PSU4_47780 [Pseudonocardia sulfidoxydans NBRC 16205]|uniref:Uncharacterized protein n=2 Tax=Pseudonocardia sulfidoxydans TaxID=54011 RepID=A0A511DPV0_9PSEU|nr:Vms1/Ankzf1 family peptidyl-tRNA hydrolase [Pseudonocardia sulfidoxydans]GEL25824.1 hypothetical protein PSU4_47780 [Pseudonocardia sulfidoxydans NBRC 16205]
MRVDWLRPACDRPGPFATVLIDATHDTEDAAELARLRRRAVADDLTDQGAPAAVRDLVDAALADVAPADGTAGRVLVVDDDGVLVDRLTPVPPATALTRWGLLPQFLAVVTEVPEVVRTVTVHVDEAGGEVAVPGEEPVTVGGEMPVHKVPAGGPSHLSMQERVEESWRRNTAAVAEAVDRAVQRTGADVVVLTGDARARARLRDRLARRSVEVLVEIENSAGDRGADLPDTVARAEDDVRDRHRRTALDRFAQAAGHGDGLAVTGEADVLAAARAQAVETLLVDPAAVPADDVWVGADPAAVAADEAGLAAMGSSPAGRVSVVDALLRAAVATDAEVVVTGGGGRRDPLDPDAPGRSDDPEDSGDPQEGPALRHGLGAILRFALAPT